MTCLMVCILRIFDKTILLTVYLMDVSSSSNYSGIFIFILYVCNEVFYELRLIQLKTTQDKPRYKWTFIGYTNLYQTVDASARYLYVLVMAVYII